MLLHQANQVALCQVTGRRCLALQREREIYFKSHISWWEHSSHFRLIGRGVPSVSIVSQLVYKFLYLASPKESPQVEGKSPVIQTGLCQHVHYPFTIKYSLTYSTTEK